MPKRDEYSAVAFDPGQTTGYALLLGGIISVGQFQTHQSLKGLIRPGRVVIYERPFFSLSLNPALNTIVFEVTGAIKGFAYANHCPLVSQEASAPHFMTRRYPHLPKLIKISQHRIDAFLHLAYFLTHNRMHVDRVWTMEEVQKAYSK